MTELRAIRLPITGASRRIILFEAGEGAYVGRRAILNEDDLWPREDQDAARRSNSSSAA